MPTDTSDAQASSPIPPAEPASSSGPEEPIEALSALEHEIDLHYIWPTWLVPEKTRDGPQAEDRVAEVTHIRIDPEIKHIDIKQAIEYGVDRFADSIPYLKKALSEISKIHPVVTVIELEMTRRENDRRVTVLFVEMKEVMSVITHFKDLQSNDIGRDGIPLNVRLRELAEGTAEDIKHCANLCDAFLKSRLLVRVLKGPLWAERFASTMERFARRKEEYSLALAMHTASTVTRMAVDIESIDIKMQLMFDFFEKYMSATEKNLAAQVEKEGGATKVRHEDTILKKLIGAAGAKETTAGASARPDGGHDLFDSPIPALMVVTDRGKGAQPDITVATRQRVQSKGPDALGASGKDGTVFGLNDLKRELREDLDDTIERNFSVFLRKYEFQTQVMSERIIHAVEAAVSGGTHSRIKHAASPNAIIIELQELWKAMNWTGVVKGRILVHALREHYAQDDVSGGPTQMQGQVDKWALHYLNIAWLNPILEAIDDDTSGYISVSEVNKFMQRLPQELDWRLTSSVLEGWKCATSTYLDEIQSIVQELHNALPDVLSVNRPGINSYLKVIPVWTLLAGMERYYDSAASSRFKPYIDMEEERIRANLEKFNYRIDARDTLKLIVGSARIERCIAVLFCLIMRNDLRKVRLATRRILAKEEFDSSTTSMVTIDGALCDRCDELRETFVQRRLDPTIEIKKFASGLLTYFIQDLNIPGEWWTAPENKIDIRQTTVTYRDNYYYEPSDGITILPEIPLDTAAYDEDECETEADLTSHPVVQPIIGRWNGFLYEPGLYPSRPMTTLFFHAAPPKQASEDTEEDSELAYGFTGEGADFEGSEYIVNGTCKASDEGTVVEWCMEYDGDVTLYFKGLILDEFTLSGEQGYDKASKGNGWLILKKAPADYVIFRPSPFELRNQPHPFDYEVNFLEPGQPARALWRFALSAVQHEIRRKRWAWSYFEERRRLRKLWYNLRSSVGGYHGDWELQPLHQLTTAADARLYNSVTDYTDRMLSAYDSWTCDAPGCYKAFRLGIVICLPCISHDYRNLMAFCDDPACYDVEHPDLECISSGELHLLTHDLVKCRGLILIPYVPSLQERAQDCLAEARRTLEDAEAHGVLQLHSPASSARIVELQEEGPDQDDAQENPATDADHDRDSQHAVMSSAEEAEHASQPVVSPPTESGAESQGNVASGTAQDHLALPTHPEDALAPSTSRWSIRSFLTNASPWSKKHAAPEPSAADASSTLAPSHIIEIEAHDADAEAKPDDPTDQPPSEEAAAAPAEPEAGLPAPAPAPSDAPDKAPSPAATSGETDSIVVISHGDDGDDSGDERDPDTASTNNEPSLYATATDSTVSLARTEAGSSWHGASVSWPPPPPKCHVCETLVGWGCWYCIECRDFICTECDAARLIRCVSCLKPFPQVPWYYGADKQDDFRCDVCTAHRHFPRVDPTHVATHALVFCRRPASPTSGGDGLVPAPAPDAVAPPASPTPAAAASDPSSPPSPAAVTAVSEERLRALEAQVAAVNARLERFDELQSQVAQIRDMLARVLEQRAA
ncbi:hypothetical protein ACG7TL_000892 [Trametes sanguinea]